MRSLLAAAAAGWARHGDATAAALAIVASTSGEELVATVGGSPALRSLLHCSSVGLLLGVGVAGEGGAPAQLWGVPPDGSGPPYTLPVTHGSVVAHALTPGACLLTADAGVCQQYLASTGRVGPAAPTLLVRDPWAHVHARTHQSHFSTMSAFPESNACNA